MTTRPPPDPTPGSDEELHALFRAGRTADEPPPALDRAILAAAREAAASTRNSQASATRPRARAWWQTWLAPVSLVLVAVVGLSLSVRIAEDPSYERLDVAPKATTPAPAAAPVAPPPAPAPASAAPPSPAPERKTVAAPAGRPAPAEAVPRPAAEAFIERAARQKREAVSSERAAAAAQSVLPSASGGRAAEREAPAAEPAPPRPGLMKAAPEADALRDAPAPKALAAPAAEAAEAAKPARRETTGSSTATLNRMQAKESAGPAAEASVAPAKAAPASAGTPAAPATDDIAAREADPALWLAEIRKLRVAGRAAEAAAELERFRKRHPGHPVPADLLQR